MSYSRKQADHVLDVFDRRAYSAQNLARKESQTEVEQALQRNKAALKKIDKKACNALQKILDENALSNIFRPMISETSALGSTGRVHVDASHCAEFEAELTRINDERNAARAVFLPVMNTEHGFGCMPLTQTAVNKLNVIRYAREKLEIQLATEDSTVNLESFFHLAKI